MSSKDITTTSGAESEPSLSLPLDAWHRAQGARMVEFAGYRMPMQYRGIIAEHTWTRSHASLFDVSHMGQLLLTAEGGAARVAKDLESLVPSRLVNLAVGRMRYSLLLTKTGGIIDDLMISNRGADFYLVVNGARKAVDIDHLRAALPADIRIEVWQSRALLALQGPSAAVALARLVPNVENLTFMSAGAFAWQGAELWISRSGYTGEDGFEISLPADIAAAFADALLADEAVQPAGLGARDSLRLEAGLPLYGQDLDETIDPISAGLGFAVSKLRCGLAKTASETYSETPNETSTEDDHFFGKAQLVALLKKGVEHKRVGLRVEGRLPLRAGAVLYDKDKHRIGRVTSGGFAPSVGAPIAMGYIAADYSAATAYSEVRGTSVSAEIAPLPFVEHRYVRKSAANSKS